ncbi:MAG: DegT/DnrJ/EryC1/StrS family aminotransferase, partial [Phreatobacter sp.]
LPTGLARQDVIDHLRTRGIQTTIHYGPVHQLTLYRQLCPGVHLPRTEDFAQRELTLPLHPAMDADDVEMVVAALADAVVGDVAVGAVA